MAEPVKETITVRFRKAIITPQGEIKQLEISQSMGEGAIASIVLTKEQARSLAKEITRKFGEE